MNFLSFLSPKRSTVTTLEVRFHKDANFFGEHGQLNVSHVRQGLKGVPVRFVFVGVSKAPDLTLGLYSYIWDQAQQQGYIPHHLVSYGEENAQVVGRPLELSHDEAAAVPA